MKKCHHHLFFFFKKDFQPEGLSQSTHLVKYRSCHQWCSVKKGVLKCFAKSTGKHLWQSLFFDKVAGLRSATSLKKRLWHRCFPVNFAKFLRTSFLQNTSGRLLLTLVTLENSVVEEVSFYNVRLKGLPFRQLGSTFIFYEEF